MDFGWGNYDLYYTSVLWYFMKDIKKATKWAANSGKFFAIFLVVLGVLAGWGGLWFILIGIFLYMMAEASYEQTIIKETLEGVPVSEVMTRDLKSVNENLTIAKLFTNYFMHYKQDNFLVTRNKKPATRNCFCTPSYILPHQGGGIWTYPSF